MCITKQEFCKLTYSPEDCWIFRNAVDDSFWKDGDRVYYCNGVDTIWQFRDAKDGEILVSHAGLGKNSFWSAWATWHVYD
jgi:hypothetical protein